MHGKKEFGSRPSLGIEVVRLEVVQVLLLQVVPLREPLLGAAAVLIHVRERGIRQRLAAQPLPSPRTTDPLRG